MKKLFPLLFVLMITCNVFSQNENLKYEFRGVWVATVANIDWPVGNDLPVGTQMIDLIHLLDKLKDAGINAVFFQIRTECDALYESSYEPWSYWLTGEQGKAPDPYYDPLEFAISEAHLRGMELHAWFNPYRAVRKINDYEPASNHVAVQHPEWILQFGEYKMLDPGNPEVREHVLNVMEDVLTRYDIDGIHFDDYFYPYGPKVSNEDSLTFVNYNRGFANIDDWRRDNINQLMREIHEVIQETKPYVKFGISPFGIVKNKYAGTDGFESYDILYCDPLTWLEEKIVDYINPQLYWEMDHDRAPYSKLQPWWATVTNGRHLYIGLYSSKMMGLNYEGSLNEIGDQIKMNRESDNVHGEVFFSAKSIGYNWRSFADTLKNNYYKYVALPPQMSWKDTVPPNVPKFLTVTVNTHDVIVNWDASDVSPDGEYPSYYLVYRFGEGEQVNIADPSKIVYKTVPNETIFLDPLDKLPNGKYIYIVTAFDRLHNESVGYAKGEITIN